MNIPFTIPDPVESVVRSKLYNELIRTLDTLMADRAAASLRIEALSAELRSSAIDGKRGASSHQVATIERATIQREQLTRELAFARRLLEHYFPYARRERQRALQVAAEVETLTRENVRKVFNAQFDPKRFPASPEAMDQYVNTHPTVRYAMDRVRGLYNDPEQQAIIGITESLALANETYKATAGVLEEARAQLPLAKERERQQAEAEAEEARQSAEAEKMLAEESARIRADALQRIGGAN